MSSGVHENERARKRACVVLWAWLCTSVWVNERCVCVCVNRQTCRPVFMIANLRNNRRKKKKKIKLQRALLFKDFCSLFFWLYSTNTVHCGAVTGLWGGKEREDGVGGEGEGVEISTETEREIEGPAMEQRLAYTLAKEERRQECGRWNQPSALEAAGPVQRAIVPVCVHKISSGGLALAAATHTTGIPALQEHGLVSATPMSLWPIWHSAAAPSSLFAFPLTTYKVQPFTQNNSPFFLSCSLSVSLSRSLLRRQLWVQLGRGDVLQFHLKAWIALHCSAASFGS